MEHFKDLLRSNVFNPMVGKRIIFLTILVDFVTSFDSQRHVFNKNNT